MMILASVKGHSTCSTYYPTFGSLFFSFFISISSCCCLLSFSSFCFFWFFSMSQMMQDSPEMIMKALQKHLGVNRPTLQPRHIRITIRIGKTIAKKNFLILSLHLKSTKQGRLKNDVHWLSHISADKLSIVSTIELTWSSTALTAVLTALIVVSCSCWNLCSAEEMAVLAVDLMVFSALEMMLWLAEVSWLMLDVTVSVAELAVLLAELMRDEAESKRPPNCDCTVMMRKTRQAYVFMFIIYQMIQQCFGITIDHSWIFRRRRRRDIKNHWAGRRRLLVGLAC